MQKKVWMYAVIALAVAGAVLPLRADVTPAQRAGMQAHLDKAHALLQSNDPSQSVKESTLAIEMAAQVTGGGADFKNTLAAAYRYRGVAQSGLHEWKKAVADFNEALKLNPHDADSLVGRGNANSNFGLGMFATVKEEPNVPPLDDFAAALKINPQSGPAYVGRGKFYQIGFTTEENLRQALPEYEKATQVDPTYAEGWYRHATVLVLSHKAELEGQAKSDFDRAIELSPKAEYFTARATFLSRQIKRDYPAIIADFTSAIQYAPADPARYTDRADAQAYAPAPDHAQMLADYSQAIDLLQTRVDSLELMQAYGADDPATAIAEVDLSHAQQSRGDLQLQNGKFPEALADFNNALKNVPTNTNALAGRAQVLIAAGKPEMAIHEISARMAHIRHDTNENTATRLFAARGQAFLSTKQYDEALLDLNQAIKTDSIPSFNSYAKNPDWYFWRALAWSNKGDNAHALADLNVAAKLNPAFIERIKGTEFEKFLTPQAAGQAVIIENGDTAVLHNLMGSEWAAAGSPANAASEFEKAVALDPQYADAYDSLGVAWMQLENYDSADEDMDKAIALKPGEPRFYANRAALRLHEQRPADAVADAKKATELGPATLSFWSTLATAQQLNGDYAGAQASLNTALPLAAGDKSETAALRMKLLIVRAIQNQALAKAELDAFLASAGKDNLRLVLRACDAEITRHPQAAALKDLRAAVAAQVEKE